MSPACVTLPPRGWAGSVPAPCAPSPRQRHGGFPTCLLECRLAPDRPRARALDSTGQFRQALGVEFVSENILAQVSWPGHGSVILSSEFVGNAKGKQLVISGSQTACVSGCSWRMPVSELVQVGKAHSHALLWLWASAHRVSDLPGERRVPVGGHRDPNVGSQLGTESSSWPPLGRGWQGG